MCILSFQWHSTENKPDIPTRHNIYAKPIAWKNTNWEMFMLDQLYSHEFFSGIVLMIWLTFVCLFVMIFSLWMQWSQWWSISIWTQFFLASSNDSFSCISSCCFHYQGWVSSSVVLWWNFQVTQLHYSFLHSCRSLFSSMEQNALRFI